MKGAFGRGHSMKTYTIVTGVSGAGKSSFIGGLREKAVPCADIETCLEKGISFTQETTLTDSSAEYIVSKAKELDYYIEMYYIGLNTFEEYLARVKNRVMRGGHNVTEADLRYQFAKRWDTLKEILPYCDEAHFLDNDNGFVNVAEYRNGEVVRIGELRPDWLAELQRFLLGIY